MASSDAGLKDPNTPRLALPRERLGLWPIVGVVVLAVLSVLVPLRAALRVQHPVDDVYITLTYARSIASGHGFRLFPTSAPSLGTTTPLFAFILAIPAFFAPDADLGGTAVFLSAMAWLSTAWLWFLRGPMLGLSRLESFIVAAIITVELPLYYLLGFEHHLFFLLVTSALVTWAGERRVACGVLIALATLTRAEGILLVPALVAVELSGLDDSKPAERRAPLARRLQDFSLGLLPPLLAWAMYAHFSIGHVLPLTLPAKIAQVTTQKTHDPFLVGLMAVFRDGWTSLPVIEAGRFQVSSWLPLAALGLCVSLRARRLLLPLAVWGLLFGTGYGLIQAPFYPWYATGLQYVLAVFAALAVGSLASVGQRLSDPRLRRAFPIGAVALCGIVVVRVSEAAVPTEPLDGIRRQDYQELASWVDEHTESTSRIGFYEVGYLSYYSHRRVVDLLGLTDAELVPALFVSPQDLEPVFRAAALDYWIDSEIMPNGASIRRSEQLGAHFSKIAHLPGTGTSYDVYRRDAVGHVPDRRRVELGEGEQGDKWGGPERTAGGIGFRWMLSREVPIDIPPVSGADSRLSIRVLQEMLPGLALGLGVRVDGRPVAMKPEVPDARPPLVRCSESFPNTEPGRHHVVELMLDKTAIPNDIDPTNADRRTLGVAVEWIKLQPAGEACP